MLGKPLMYLSSYAPLFGLLAVRFDDQRLRMSCLVLAAAGAGALVLLLRLGRGVAPSPHRFVRVTTTGAEASSYLASYLLPFLTVSDPTGRDVVAYVGFLVVAGAVSMQTSMLQVNPLLYVLGYRVYGIEDSAGMAGYVITRRRLAAGDTALAHRFSSDVLIEARQIKRGAVTA